MKVSEDTKDSSGDEEEESLESSEQQLQQLYTKRPSAKEIVYVDLPTKSVSPSSS